MDNDEYKRCKLTIKNWEKKFKENEKRNPTKDDIKTAPISVKDAYKQYWYIKTSLLEEAIIEDERPVPVDVPAQIPNTKVENENICAIPSSVPVELEDVSNSYKNSTRVDESITDSDNAVCEFVNKETVWGDHLKRTVISGKDVPSKKSTSCQFTEKLFKGLKLKKRNPRKSINFLEKSKSFDCNQSSADENSQNFSEIKSDPVEPSDACSSGENIFDSSRYVKITGGKSLNVAQPVDILNGIDSPQIRPRLFKNKVDEGWLERCEKQCQLLNPTERTEPTFENTDGIQNIAYSSDEDYVYSSDDELPKTSGVKFASKTPLLVPEIASNNGENQNTSSIPENSASDFSSENSVDPINAAKKLIKSHLNNGSGGLKRLAPDDISNIEKKIKITDFDAQRKMNMLEKKLASGKANENFVSIDIKRKRFVRGKKGNLYSKFKKQNWKMKKKIAHMESSENSSSAGILKCFRCGDVGHFSRQCKKKNTLIPVEEFSDTEDSPFPTLEEAAEMAKTKQNRNGVNNEVAEMLEMCDSIAQPNLNEDLKSVPPLCDCDDEASIKYNTTLLHQALKKFGYDAFRPGQKEAMMRIISGKSALFVSSTGSGKSLCYQIPSYLYSQSYQCISLVISPLVSLMEDQVINFPSFLKAACLHTNQTTSQRDQIIEKIKNNQISVLLISPEAIVSGEHGILGHDLMKHFPPVAFVCIDEVHCVSQWSHNFRFTYLMICRVLKERFKVRTFLGLTATATMSTINSIIDHLNIPKEEMINAVLQNTVLPDNLMLAVSQDENKDWALVKLLKQAPFSEYDSIIIYCLRRNECERLASFIRTSLEDLKKPIQMFGERGALSAEVEVYHAGLSAARRKRVQNSFMKGKLRIVVATVAFGMGINKSDIRGIIHYNLPKTFEHYVQEIGRAGRDGLPARCHLFLDAKGNDMPELKRHIFSNSVDRYVIRKLLQKVFRSCNCVDVCEKHELAFSMEETVRVLDLNQESISTLLCYLELLPEQIVKVLPPAYTICTVQSFGGAKPLQQAAKKCPPLAYAIAEHGINSNSSKISSKYEFDVIALADKIKWKSGVVKNELKQCEWKKNDKGAFRKTDMSVTFREIGFHILARGNLSEEQLDQALNTLHSRVTSQENIALDQLDICFKVFKGAAYNTVEDALTEDSVAERDNKLKSQIRKYFIEETRNCTNREIVTELKDKSTVMCNIHRLISSHRDCNFTGRTIARIFHGIESPNYPTKMWYSSPFWRCSLDEDFNVLCRFATNELIKLKESW